MKPKRTSIPKEGIEHGLSGYNKRKCGCVVCVEAMKAAYRHKKLRAANTEPKTHGTTYSYSVYRCRCDACKRAWKLATMRYTEAYRDRGVFKHGTETGYRLFGCRCGECKAIHALAHRTYLAKVKAKKLEEKEKKEEKLNGNHSS